MSLGSLTRVFKFKRPTYQSFFKRLTCWKTNKRLKHSVILNKKQTFEKVSHVLMVKNTLKGALTIFGFRKVQNRELPSLTKRKFEKKSSHDFYLNWWLTAQVWFQYCVVFFDPLYHNLSLFWCHSKIRIPRILLKLGKLLISSPNFIKT